MLQGCWKVKRISCPMGMNVDTTALAEKVEMRVGKCGERDVLSTLVKNSSRKGEGLRKLRPRIRVGTVVTSKAQLATFSVST